MEANRRQRPFLKWAGGKYQLLKHILPQLPKHGTLVEPFVGAGAVFMNADIQRVHINDINPDLMLVYKSIKKHGKKFIEYTRQYFDPCFNNRDNFYAFRDEFNNTPADMHKAALFIYLNRHGYNGLCRYNASGVYNVPFGEHRNPLFPEKSMQHAITRLKRSRLTCRSFEKVMKECNEDCIVYCDPPYVPLSDSSDFTKYHTKGFNLKAQEKLARQAEQLAGRGTTVIISNHDTPLTRKLYHKAKIIRFQAPRSISANGGNRKAVVELLAIF